MKFEAFKEFKFDGSQKIVDLAKYLSEELSYTLRGLRSGLTKLRFTENFECFEVEISIEAGQEYPVRNLLRDAIPRYWIAARKNEAALSVCDGDTDWSKDYLYLKNTHATDTATLTVLFFR